MVLDAVLSIAHWWAVLAMVVVLATELTRCRGTLDREAVRALALRDALYGGLAGLVLLAGLLRAWLGAKGWSFYAGNTMFWIKIGLFALVALLSLVPTVRLLRWRRELTAGGTIDADRTRAIRRWIHAELAVLALIPVAAALMARGIGY